MAWMDRKRESSDAPGGGPAGRHSRLEAGTLDTLLDLVGGLLREYGRGAFDMDNANAATVNSLCEQWARHLLSGLPRPGDTGMGQCLPLEERDWRGALQFFTNQRREENHYVGKAVRGQRQVLWSFIQGFYGALAQDMQSDDQIHSHLERLKTTVETGSLDTLKKEVLSTVSEIGRVVSVRKEQQRARIQELHTQVRELGDQLQVARQKSSLDALTSLYNRSALDERIAQAIQMRKLFRQPACLLLIDLDHFKRVNDTWGHTVGDQVLRAVAKCMLSTFRVKSDFVARYGGEEFAVVLWDTPLGAGGVSALRLLEAVPGMRLQHEGREIRVTVSIGISEVIGTDTPVSWIERCDRALYEAKRTGRNRVVQVPVPSP